LHELSLGLAFVFSPVDRLVRFFDRSSRVRPGSRSLFLASHLGGPQDKESKKKATPVPAPAARVPAAMAEKAGSAKTRLRLRHLRF
jgi:hypothetical protein